MLPGRMVERRVGGSPFQRDGPMHTKDLDCAIVVLTRVTKRSNILYIYLEQLAEPEYIM